MLSGVLKKSREFVSVSEEGDFIRCCKQVRGTQKRLRCHAPLDGCGTFLE